MSDMMFDIRDATAEIRTLQLQKIGTVEQRKRNLMIAA